MKEIEHEALPETGIIKNAVAFSDKQSDGTYIITFRYQTRRQKQPNEYELRFTQNGINALLGSLIVQSGNEDMIK